MARKNPDKQPSKNAEDLSNLLADQQLDLDDIAEAYRESVAGLQYELMVSSKGRNEGIWDSAEADITLTTEDFMEIPVSERDDNWVLQFNSMYAAAYMQAVAESGLLADIVAVSDKHSEALIKQNNKMKPNELKEVATEGTLNGKLKERQNIRTVELS